MALQRFEDSLAWQKAQDLLEIIEDGMVHERRYWFKDQLCRAALSISNNIAEGFGRPTKADRMRYLVIARGSGNEVRSMLHYAKRKNYLNPEAVDRAMSLSLEIGKLTRSYMDPVTRQFGHLPGYLIILSAVAFSEAIFSRALPA